jgi:hypothetical protein
MQDVIEFLAVHCLKIHPRAVSQWRRRRRVPHEHRLALLDLGERMGLKIDRAAFDTIRPDRWARVGAVPRELEGRSIPACGDNLSSRVARGSHACVTGAQP